VKSVRFLMMKKLTILPVLIGFALAVPSVWSQADVNTSKKAGTATLVVGDVSFVEKAGDTKQALKSGAVLKVGSTIFTGRNSRAVVLTSRQSAIRIGANSEVVLDEMKIGAAGEKPKVQVNLKQGSLGALIKSKELGAMDFKVKTPHGIAAARGTFYAVAVTDDKTYTQVGEGVVEVRTSGDAATGADKGELDRAIPPKTQDENPAGAANQ